MSDWFEAGGAGQRCDAEAMLDSAAMKTLYELVAAGALLGLSLTSDGGALGVTLTVDGRWRRDYFRNSEELEEWTAGAREPVLAALAARAAASASRVPGRRPRRL